MGEVDASGGARDSGHARQPERRTRRHDFRVARVTTIPASHGTRGGQDDDLPDVVGAARPFAVREKRRGAVARAHSRRLRRPWPPRRRARRSRLVHRPRVLATSRSLPRAPADPRSASVARLRSGCRLAVAEFPPDGTPSRIPPPRRRPRMTAMARATTPPPPPPSTPHPSPRASPPSAASRFTSAVPFTASSRARRATSPCSSRPTWTRLGSSTPWPARASDARDTSSNPARPTSTPTTPRATPTTPSSPRCATFARTPTRCVPPPRDPDPPSPSPAETRDDSSPECTPPTTNVSTSSTWIPSAWTTSSTPPFRWSNTAGTPYVTCTDALALCGRIPPALSSRFGGAHVAANVAGVNETALRVFVGDAVRRGAAQGLKLTPVFSLFHPHGPVFRAISRAERGEGAWTQDDAGYVGQCWECGEARRLDGGKELGGCFCHQCADAGDVNVAMDVSGPMWLGPLHERETIRRLRARSRRRLGRRRRRVRVRETRGDAQGTKDHRETSRDVRVRVRSEAAAVLPPDGRARARGGDGRGIPPMNAWIAELRRRGYAACRSHVDARGLKTNATVAEANSAANAVTAARAKR